MREEPQRKLPEYSRVVLVSTKYGVASTNPVKGLYKDLVVGTLHYKISSIDSDFVYQVKWDNGTENSYEEGTLELHQGEISFLDVLEDI